MLEESEFQVLEQKALESEERQKVEGGIQSAFPWAVRLSHSLAVYLPTNPPESESWREMVKRCFIRSCGGCTSTMAQGGWLSQRNGQIMQEPVEVIGAACDDRALALAQKELVSFLQEMGRSMKQESIAVSVDGDMFLVDVLPA
jgi:hypothetical protein